jgi:hypothetical protein
MIGFIRIADILKMLIGLLVGILLFGGFALAMESFPDLRRRTPEWVFAVAILLIFWAAIESGEPIWEWIQDHSKRAT